MLNFAALAVIAGPVILALLVRLRLGGTWSTPRVAFAALFALYALKVVELTLFPIPVDGDMAGSFSSTSFFTFLELVPLAGITEQGALTPAFLRNIALGVPFGFGIWFLDASMTRRRAVLLGAAASAAVELLQLAIGALVGFVYRVVDINDLIANTIGVVLGLLVFELLAGALRRVDRGLPPGSGRGLWAYVGRVAAAPVRSERSRPASLER